MTEREEKAISNLKTYINNGTYKVVTDFEKYCHKHCEDIETVLHLLETKNAEIEILKKTIEYWKNGFERELEANRKNVLELIKQDNIIKNQKEALNQANKKILAQRGHLKVLNKKAEEK